MLLVGGAAALAICSTMIADEKLLEWSDCLRLLESSENAHLREEAASKLKAALGRLSRELSTERFEKLGWELQQRVFALLRKEVSRSGGGESTNRSCTPIFSSPFSSTAIIKSIKSCIHTNSAIETLVELVPCGVPARTCFSRNSCRGIALARAALVLRWFCGRCRDVPRAKGTQRLTPMRANLPDVSFLIFSVY